MISNLVDCSIEQIKSRAVAAFAQDVELPMGLILDEVEIRAKNVAWKDGLSLANPAEALVRISEARLQAFAASQLPPMVHNLQVRFCEGLILATASVRVVFEVSATAHLALEIVNSQSLHLKLVSFEGPSVARSILENQIAQRNPVFEATSLPMPITLDRVAVGEMLELAGTVSVLAVN
ncbi:MAG: LmeA family phospholipid-binding protein [Fimbriimonadaceae bacterium]|nr:LmeA family phospholipid-binding protein [Fimbriimonadaceae bacterium]